MIAIFRCPLSMAKLLVDDFFFPETSLELLVAPGRFAQLDSDPAIGT
jgi:hypothetical protein